MDAFARSLLRAMAPILKPSVVVFDFVERDTVHVDELGRSLDSELHQIDQQRSAGDEARAHCGATRAIARASSTARRGT